MTATAALGIGLATISTVGAGSVGPGGDPDAKVLDTWYPMVKLDDAPTAAAALAGAVGHTDGSGTYELDDSHVEAVTGQQSVSDAVRDAVAAAKVASPVDTGTQRRAVVTFIDALDAAPVDAHDVYLRLHLLSLRLVQPHGVSLEGAFGLLNNVVWTDLGPCDPDGFTALRLRLEAQGHRVRVTSVDKFPRMTDYVVPSGVRIGDADRVRLGAHLASGTTVMHEGFVNFNAGTLGASMVEGRISAGVVLGDGSDLGGSASVMGTLSGGGKEVIRVGEQCLIGANAGVGISLGDRCVIEAGLYITAGTKVTLPDGSIVKAKDLSGQDGLLFLRDSLTGKVLAKKRSGESADWGGLNADLHAND